LTRRIGTWLRAFGTRARTLALRFGAVDPDGFRRALRARDWPFVDPDRAPPSAAAVERTVDRLVARARRRASVAALATGRRGPVVALISARLAHRLALVYGRDPTRDTDRAAIGDALAGAEILGADHLRRALRPAWWTPVVDAATR
jgi:Lon protease-like protein